MRAWFAAAAAAADPRFAFEVVAAAFVVAGLLRVVSRLVGLARAVGIRLAIARISREEISRHADPGRMHRETARALARLAELAAGGADAGAARVAHRRGVELEEEALPHHACVAPVPGPGGDRSGRGGLSRPAARVVRDRHAGYGEMVTLTLVPGRLDAPQCVGLASDDSIARARAAQRADRLAAGVDPETGRPRALPSRGGAPA